MATEEDNLDLDVYDDVDGDGTGNDNEADYYEDDEHTFTVDEHEPEPALTSESQNESSRQEDAPVTTDTHLKTSEPNNTPSQDSITAQSRGVKRKDSSHSRSIESGATTALLLSDLHWWITEDDIRGWINKAGAEDDLTDVTFNEHKVNGKSKGQVYLGFGAAEASSAAKRHIEHLTEGPNSTRKFAVTFTSPSHNPFKTLPKDGPARPKEERSSRGSSSAYNTGRGDFDSRGSGYRGRGRGYERGGYGNQGYNRNFSGPAAGYNSGAFQNNMGGMNNFNFNRGGTVGNNMRGGMGGMRGGRGAMNPMMPMGGMMGMNPMMAGMGMPGFQGNQFGFGNMYNQGHGSNFGNDWGQPGAKRQRQE